MDGRTDAVKMQEDIIKGRDDAGGQYKREGWCTRRTV